MTNSVNRRRPPRAQRLMTARKEILAMQFWDDQDRAARDRIRTRIENELRDLGWECVNGNWYPWSQIKKLRKLNPL